MGKFEEDRIYQVIDTKVLCCYRLVDDIFMIWKETEPELKNFFSKLNSLHPSIKFDCKSSRNEIKFLETTVCINNSNKLTIKLYKKDTDRTAYLHYKSYHPLKLKDNIRFGQALRVKKVCSENTDVENALAIFKSNSIGRWLNLPKLHLSTEEEKEKEKENTVSNRVRFSPTLWIYWTKTGNVNIPPKQKS